MDIILNRAEGHDIGLQVEPFRWAGLPTEVRLRILEATAWKPRRCCLTKRSIIDPSLARYASVCREWQEFFEKRTFSHLALHQRDIEHFGKIVRHRAYLVEHIWLRVELRRYGCPTCMKSEKEDEKRRNNKRVGKAVLELFSILSLWEHGHGRLTLDISIHSPSDSQHYFKEYSVQPVSHGTGQCEEAGLHTIHDPEHGWRKGQRVAIPSDTAMFRFIGNIVSLDIDYIPIVRVVKNLLIRRQTVRTMASKALQQIIMSLPQLESIQFEPWRELEDTFQARTDKGMVHFFVLWTYH